MLKIFPQDKLSQHYDRIMKHSWKATFNSNIISMKNYLYTRKIKQAERSNLMPVLIYGNLETEKLFREITV
jgi:hypothetical protein